MFGDDSATSALEENNASSTRMYKKPEPLGKNPSDAEKELHLCHETLYDMETEIIDIEKVKKNI